MKLEKKIDMINNQFSELENRKIAIWGAGVHTVQLMAYTNLINLDICFFVDKSEPQYIKYLYGKPVVYPENAEFEEIDNIIISSYKYQSEIRDEIEKRGYKGKEICIYDENDEGEFYHLLNRNAYYFVGNYPSWKEAEKNAVGYSEHSIVEKVLESTQLVINGKACFERDSVVFNHTEYNYKLLFIYGLLVLKNSQVNILDFGGALGSEYWKNRKMIYEYSKNFTWNIVEQSNYVEIGNGKVSNKELFFYKTIDEIDKKIDLVIMSGVLQYIEDYKSIFQQIIEIKPEYIIIDRQPVGDSLRVCIQYVKEKICKSSYPMRIITENELLSLLSNEYVLLSSSESMIDHGTYYVDEKAFQYKDYLFQRRIM